MTGPSRMWEITSDPVTPKSDAQWREQTMRALCQVFGHPDDVTEMAARFVADGMGIDDALDAAKRLTRVPG